MNTIELKAYCLRDQTIYDVNTLHTDIQSVVCNGLKPLHSHIRLGFNEFRLMVYTGMKDKAGQKIFSGHIVKCDNCDYPAEVVYTKSLGMFGLDTHNINTRNNPMQSCSFDEATIIGTIYQNPELIIRREAEPLVIDFTYCECSKRSIACHDCVCHIEQFYKDED